MLDRAVSATSGEVKVEIGRSERMPSRFMGSQLGPSGFNITNAIFGIATANTLFKVSMMVDVALIVQD